MVYTENNTINNTVQQHSTTMKTPPHKTQIQHDTTQFSGNKTVKYINILHIIIYYDVMSLRVCN